MTPPVACSLCSKPYVLGPEKHRAFCAACVDKLNVDAARASLHMVRIRAGDMRVTPTSDTERDLQHSARRSQLPRASRDCYKRNHNQ